MFGIHIFSSKLDPSSSTPVVGEKYSTVFLSKRSSNAKFTLTGPGCSSIGGGAFTELGPFYPRGDGRGLRRNPMSWNKGIG